MEKKIRLTDPEAPTAPFLFSVGYQVRLKNDSTAQGTIRGGQFVGGLPGGAYGIHYEIEQEEGFVFLAGEIDLEKVD
ncbi:MAG: hypothetical protein HY694_08870 [Deltaproteobacteria bacterium]|nr:hypothetical protein [Deltaproteobacteria bacterium]